MLFIVIELGLGPGPNARRRSMRAASTAPRFDRLKGVGALNAAYSKRP
jgi:hypothetical protein